jgi:F-type H+-transporting ATPase subunit delta
MQKVVITTARPLSAATLKNIKELLVKKYGANLEYKVELDPSVLGGAKVLVGTQEIDASVARKLTTLRSQLLADA